MVFTLNLDSPKNVLHRQNLYKKVPCMVVTLTHDTPLCTKLRSQGPEWSMCLLVAATGCYNQWKRGRAHQHHDPVRGQNTRELWNCSSGKWRIFFKLSPQGVPSVNIWLVSFISYGMIYWAYLGNTILEKTSYYVGGWLSITTRDYS